MDQILEEAIPLIAEDLRSARVRLGITSAGAAKRARLSRSRYTQIETGKIRRSKQSLHAMISVAESLGMKTLRMSYVDFLDQYMQVAVVRDQPQRIFIDTLDTNIAKLKEQGHFVSPHLLMDFADREGFWPIYDSRTSVDKMIVELWVTTIFTLSLNGNRDYYVRPMSDDPPDTEVLVEESRKNALSLMRVEITLHSRHSTDLTEVIGKKLEMRYHDDTILLVFLEEGEALSIVDLYDFIERNNPHRQQIVIIGGAGGAGRFKIVPWGNVSVSDEIVWGEITVDTNDRSSARCKYDGVVFQPPYTSRFRPLLPVFVKTVSLHR